MTEYLVRYEVRITSNLADRNVVVGEGIPDVIERHPNVLGVSVTGLTNHDTGETIDTEIFEADQMLGNRTFDQWHAWLLTERTIAGQPVRSIADQASYSPRYGATRGDCAWWAIAVEYIFVQIKSGNGSEQSIAASMGAALEGVEELGEVVNDHLHLLPVHLVRRLLLTTR